MPDTKGKYSLPECIRWRLEQASKQAPSEEETEKDRWLARVRREQAKMARLERLEKEGQLVSYDLSLQILSEEVVAAQNALRGVGRKLAPSLVGLDAREIEASLNDEHDRILTRLANRLPKKEKNAKRSRR